MNVWSAAEGESRAFSRRFWVRTKIETKGDSLLDRRFASRWKKKNWKEWYEKEILWENCINIIIVSRNFFPQREGEILWLTCLRSIWISILIKANYWHWSVFEMEVSSVQSITIMRIFFRGIGYLSKFIIHKLGGCRNLGVKVETVSSLEGWAVRGVFQVSSWPWKKIHGQQVPCSLL